jgi:hypothetical protein
MKKEKALKEYLKNSPEILHSLLTKVFNIHKRYWIVQHNDGDGVCIMYKINRRSFNNNRAYSIDHAKQDLIAAYMHIQREKEGGGLIIVQLIENNWTGTEVGRLQMF